MGKASRLRNNTVGDSNLYGPAPSLLYLELYKHTGVGGGVLAHGGRDFHTEYSLENFAHNRCGEKNDLSSNLGNTRQIKKVG